MFSLTFQMVVSFGKVYQKNYYLVTPTDQGEHRYVLKTYQVSGLNHFHKNTHEQN